MHQLGEAALSFPENEEMQIRDHPTRRQLRQPHRRAEDVDYWRKRAGWFDDDAAMKDYNVGVYDAYYQLDDDQTKKSGGSGNRHRGGGLSNSDLASNAIKALAVLIALGLCFLLFRVISRRWGEGKEKKKKRSSSRDRSKSRSRSRSRSRKDRGDAGYDLMEDGDATTGEDGEAKSSRSRRSSSRSKNRSRSRARSSSKSRKEPHSSSNVDPILV